MSNKTKAKDTEEQPVRRSSYVEPAGDDTATKVLPDFLADQPRAGALSMKDAVKQREAALLDPDARISMPDLPTDAMPQPAPSIESLDATLGEAVAEKRAKSNATVEGVTLRTSWDGTTPNFDVDQIAVHEWAKSDPKIVNETVGRHMSLVDSEELIEAALEAERRHAERAVAARSLAEALADRLGLSRRQIDNEGKESF